MASDAGTAPAAVLEPGAFHAGHTEDIGAPDPRVGQHLQVLTPPGAALRNTFSARALPGWRRRSVRPRPAGTLPACRGACGALYNSAGRGLKRPAGATGRISAHRPNRAWNAAALLFPVTRQPGLRLFKYLL